MEVGSAEHKENLEKMAKDVEECIEQAKFNQRYLEVHRGVGKDLVFDDDDELKRFLDLSEGEKECNVFYESKQNSLSKKLLVRFGV